MRRLHVALLAGLACMTLMPVPSAQAQTSPALAELAAAGPTLPPTKMKVIGNFSNTSIWNLGQHPFWGQEVGTLTGKRIDVSLNSLTELNLKGPEVIRLMKQGLADAVDLVANYGSADVMEFDALDLAGVMPDLETAIRGMKAYAPVVREAVAKKAGVLTLGMGPSNAQVFWCNVEIKGIEDLRGKRIRTSSATTADLVRGLGGTPVSTSGAEMVPALQRGVVDCAITGVLAGNTLKLHEVTTHLYPLVVGWAAWARVVNTRSWDRFDPSVRAWLQKATDTIYSDRVLAMVREATDQGVWCSTGDARCTYGAAQGVSKGKMKLVPVSDADKKVLARVMEEAVLPPFAKACGPECTAAWNASIGKELGLTAKAM